MDDGSIQLSYEFPADGQYRMSFGATDRRRRTLNDSRYLSANELPPPRIMTMKLDGTRIGTKAIEATQDFDRSEKVSRQIEAGVKQVWLGFIDINGKPMNPNDEFQERRLWVDYLEINGPYDAAPKPTPESHNRIFICRPEGEEPWQPCAREILGQLADRAYRRPATHTELERLMKLASNSLRNGESFEGMVQYALQAILVSPQFLFRIERDPVPDDKEGIRPIDDYELASRLSYFLWSSMPDDELFDVARSGQLNEQAVLEQQVTRMLQDPKSSAFVENFSGQWLQLRNLSQANPDMEYFPEFDEQLREAMLKETQLYFETILHEDRSILEFLDSEFTYLNERLAQHYGINNIQGDKFQRVELQDGQRGGLLGQASILTISSYPTRTSPVLRGLWVLDNILGQRPPPPTPDVPELEVKEPEIGGTLREQLEMHRANEGCRSCHLVMDAIGFGLENYNPIGQWRIKDGELPLDTSGTLPGELSFESPAELKRILMETEAESFGRTLTKKLMTYALGRGLNRDDNPAIGEIQQKLEEANYRFSALIQGIISSMPFQMRTHESLHSTASRSD